MKKKPSINFSGVRTHPLAPEETFTNKEWQGPKTMLLPSRALELTLQLYKVQVYKS